jgi:DNA-binding GntR family transcriptional regulator
MDLPQIHAHENEHGSNRLRRELEYLAELGFVKAAKGKRWRITALGRDFLLGLVEAQGVMEPAMLSDIGE